MAVAPHVGLEPEHAQQLVSSAVRAHCGTQLSEQEVRELIATCQDGLHDGMTAQEVDELIVLVLRSRAERTPLYSRLAAKLVCQVLYRDVIGIDALGQSFPARYQSALRAQMRIGVAMGVLDPRLLDFDLERLGHALVPERDALLKYMGVQMLRDRFFVRDRDGRSLETPQLFWMRVAMGLALPEPTDRRHEVALEFYEAMSTLRCLPCTSPTLYHVGTTHPQTGCYVLSVGDALHDIYRTISTDAEIASLSAGFGNDWTTVRGTCALDDEGQLTGQGPISFLKVLDSSVAAFNRSGRRHSAACAYLETWHYDIEDFLSLRRSTGDERRRVSDLSTANWIPDLFMTRVAQDADWTLFSPDEVPDLHGSIGRDFTRRYEEHEDRADRGEIRMWKRVRARDLWRRMVTRLFETGHPWMTFKDPCNVRSMQDHVGPVMSANLCTEIILNASPEGVGVTTLGSINLARHVVDGRINWGGIAESVNTGVRMLDNALEISNYPSPEIERYAREHRPIGLGVMGFQDALYEIGSAFDSEQACAISDELMEFVSRQAILASTMLARDRGSYSSFEGSKWHRGVFPVDTVGLLEQERGSPVDSDCTSRLDWSAVREAVARDGMRNCNVIAVAPTQTLANLAGCFPSIEPAYKQIYAKSNSSGDFCVLNEHLVVDLQELGLWSDALAAEIKRFDGSVQPIDGIPAEIRRRYRGAFEIDPRWVIRHAARRGKWIDQGQSINVFTDSDDGRVISALYLEAWHAGLKATYYLKTLGASAIEHSTSSPRERVGANST